MVVVVVVVVEEVVVKWGLFFMKFTFIVIFLLFEYDFRYFLVFSNVVALVVVVVDVVVVFLLLGFFNNFLPSLTRFIGLVGWVFPPKTCLWVKFLWFCGKKNKVGAGLVVNVRFGFVDVVEVVPKILLNALSVVDEVLEEVEPNILLKADSVVVVWLRLLT